ncbi:MAG TPA: phosphoribosylglycinamide formyltransferase [Solirubrobacteraceae bacterium]|nr:phosphoribosylglycinamide formyltransferase [Solirubrobacteraceae bacterium]
MRIGVLASGEGTNLQAILDRLHGRGAIEVVAVGSDKPDARALERARAAGVPARSFEQRGRRERDAAIARWLEESGAQLVVLAGYMQLLGAPFLARFPERVINVHPALLPAFPGIGAVERAYDHGVKVFGVTVHFVDEGIDTGPIIAQRALELPGASSAAEVRAALRPLEHDLLCEAVVMIASGRVAVEGGRCKVRADDAAG